MIEESALSLTPASISSEAAVWRHSCSLLDVGAKRRFGQPVFDRGGRAPCRLAGAGVTGARGEGRGDHGVCGAVKRGHPGSARLVPIH